MHLYLLRHADAEPHAASDSARELTLKGNEQARAVGEFCRRQSIRPDLVLTSPYRRTVQTAASVTAAIGGSVAQKAPFLASGMDPELAFAELRAYQKFFESVMLVGHQPDLGMLAAQLLVLPAESFPFEKASLMCIDVHQLTSGGGDLEFFLPVKMMKLSD